MDSPPLPIPFGSQRRLSCSPPPSPSLSIAGPTRHSPHASALQRSSTFSSTWSGKPKGGDQRQPGETFSLHHNELAAADHPQPMQQLILDGRRLIRSGRLRTVSVVRKAPAGTLPDDLVGIGISFRPASDGSFVVADMLADGGAIASGVLIGDVIQAVEGKSASTLSTNELVLSIRGVANTAVRLVLEATTLEDGSSPSTQRCLLPARPSGVQQQVDAESFTSATEQAASGGNSPQSRTAGGLAVLSPLSKVAQPHTQLLLSRSAARGSSSPGDRAESRTADQEEEQGHISPAPPSRSTRTAPPQTSQAMASAEGTPDVTGSDAPETRHASVSPDDLASGPAGSVSFQPESAVERESEALTLSVRPEPLLRPLDPDHHIGGSRIEADLYLGKNFIGFPVPEAQHQVEKRILRG